MPDDWCKCGLILNSERNKRVGMCSFCERIENRKIIENTAGFVERQPEIKYEDGLTYIIERREEFDD